jgi:hypothetical protein
MPPRQLTRALTVTSAERRALAAKLPTAVLAFVVVVAAIAAGCTEADPSVSPRAHGVGVYIGPEWEEARAVSGHQKHVVEQKVACAKCHELTSDSLGAVNPSKCAACHQKESRLEHAVEQARARFGPSAKTDCTTCHAFTLGGTPSGKPPASVHHVPGAEDCSRCHLATQGDTPAVTVHGTSECVQCHRPHEDRIPQPGACAECHADIGTTHAARGKTATEVCTTCHEHQHAAASVALSTCTECHAEHEPKVPASALFAGGHEACVGCHRPHDFERKAAVACQSCHAGVHALAASSVPAHNRCSSCHSPHDVRGSAEKACATCHASVHSDHPKRGAAGTCVGCHDPHPAKPGAHGSARDCSACHQTAASDSAFHGGVGCTQCHAPHAFLKDAADRTVCKSCHAEQLAQVAELAGHATCEGCHGGLPHRPARLQAGCQSCHASIHATATAGHRECTSCHEPHGGALGKSCQSCHADEHRTAPAGHRACTNCHEQHSGSPARGACATCHANEAASTHGKLAGGGCNQCHRAHGPQGVAKPPACATCHDRAKLAGLHGVQRHADCARCHSGHDGASTPQRASCLGCHQDRTQHFPDAPTCASCHLFSAAR